MEREFHFFVEPEICHEDSGSEGSEGSEDFFNDGDKEEGRNLIVRLDKWLWAARFFKTRALARAAVEAGKVFYNGERSKPSREIEVEAILQVRHGRFEKTVIVKGLSTRRRSTEEALQLFEETEESKTLREQQINDFPQNHYSQQHSSYHQNHRTQSSPSFQEQSQDQRPVRFLRRAFARPGQAPEQHQGIRQDRPQRPTAPYHNNNNNNGYNQPYYNNQSNNPNRYPHPQSGYNHSGYPQQNDNNPVYNSRPYPSGYNNSGYHNSRQQHPNYHNSVSNNKTEPQTEFE